MVFFHSNITAETFGMPFIKTCYQEFQQQYKHPQKIKLLKSGTSVDVTFGSTNIGDISAFHIYAIVDNIPLFYDYIEYPDPFTTPYTIVGVAELNTNQKYRIVPDSKYGVGSLVSYDPFEIEFVDFEFTLKNPNPLKDDNCIQLGDNGMLELEHNLTGLCMPPSFKFKPRNYNIFGIPITLEAISQAENNNIIFNNIFNGIAVSPEDCYQPYQQVDEYGNFYSVPKCEKFDLDITFYPCDFAEGDPNCPPFTITQEFLICCKCREHATGYEGPICTNCE